MAQNNMHLLSVRNLGMGTLLLPISHKAAGKVLARAEVSSESLPGKGFAPTFT